MGILQARILEWVAMPSSRGIFLTQGLNLGLLHCRRILSCLSHQGSRNLWTAARQAPLSTGILQARILEWVAMPSSRGIFPSQGSNPFLPHCLRILYHLSHQGSPGYIQVCNKVGRQSEHQVLDTQSCLTLCDPVNCGPPGSSVHGDSPGKNTGVSCHFLL